MAELGGEDESLSAAVHDKLASIGMDPEGLRVGLLEKGLIYEPRDDAVAFSVPGFAKFVRSKFPNDDGTAT
jgi:hypothetical protein